MVNWTFEDAQSQFADLVDGALAHEPQCIAVGRNAVVVLARDDYERIAPSGSLGTFLRHAPATKAIADGELPEDAFDRHRDLGRDIDV